ncbi:hypothetical protein ACSYGO_00655 [Streptomyces krungchingensis]
MAIEPEGGVSEPGIDGCALCLRRTLALYEEAFKSPHTLGFYPVQILPETAHFADAASPSGKLRTGADGRGRINSSARRCSC